MPRRTRTRGESATGTVSGIGRGQPCLTSPAVFWRALRRGWVAWPLLAVTMLATAMAFAQDEADTGDHGCPAGSPIWGGTYDYCLRVRPKPHRPIVAVIGDSTARSLDIATATLARNRGWGYVQAAQNGCSFIPLVLPLADDPPDLLPIRRRCTTGVPVVLRRVQARWHPDVVIASERFLSSEIWQNGRILKPGTKAYEAAARQALRRVLKALTGRGAQVV